MELERQLRISHLLVTAEKNLRELQRELRDDTMTENRRICANAIQAVQVLKGKLRVQIEAQPIKPEAPG